MTNPNMNRRRPKLIRGDRFTDKIFKPYVSAIGELALAWNDLHEKLGWLFYNFVDTGDGLGYRLWNAPQFDRPKRALLEAAAQSMTSQMHQDYPRLKDDILWLLKQVDTLEDARNTVIHSPLFASNDLALIPDLAAVKDLATVRTVGPNIRLQNARALRLAKKDLLT